jgi:hypothetical protein
MKFARGVRRPSGVLSELSCEPRPSRSKNIFQAGDVSVEGRKTERKALRNG